MDKKEINESNVLIAEFIGLKKGMLGEYTHPLDKPSEGYVPIYTPDGSDMKFYSDWNWLIPVVEKIESLEEVDYTKLYVEHKNIYDFEIFLKTDYMKPSFRCVTEDRMESIYDCIIQFIEWYNEQTKK